MMNSSAGPSFTRGIRREAVRTGAEAVRIGPLDNAKTLPLLIEPAASDLDFAGWADANRALIGRYLLEHRALLFRGFDVPDTKAFEAVVAATSSSERMICPDETTPRAALADRIYESTVYPKHQTIQQHQEASYCDNWPLRIYFGCLQPSPSGGATPLSDVRRVTARLRPGVLERFERLGVAYIRNFNSQGIGLTWQQAFWTESRAQVEDYCRLHRIHFEWKADDALRTAAIRPAFRKHPLSGELLWFNHALFFHLDAYTEEMREALLTAMGSENLPYETSFGDGSPIDGSIVREFLAASEAEKIAFPWQRGDVLLLDNMTVAHGRQPYEGERTVIVAMTEPQADANA